MEADPLHMAAPKAHFLKDIFMDKDTPVFATSISRIRSYSNSGINKLETEKMKVRKFNYQFQQHEIKELPWCLKCFAGLVFESSFSKNWQYIETKELFWISNQFINFWMVIFFSEPTFQASRVMFYIRFPVYFILKHV